MNDHISRWFHRVRALFARPGTSVCTHISRPSTAAEPAAAYGDDGRGEVFAWVTAHGIDFHPRECHDAEVAR
ncbi:hypothetical protein AB0F13_16205 [Streptomyces sp. NPDC026206]|uniref:hypothetical protein n=1 Tax=Streptomyces sp. NPDC026206 TaxID=3157089 RepID=UPI0033E6E5D0